jgi:hypothetical protein
MAARPAASDHGRVAPLSRSRLLLPAAVGLASTGFAATHGPLWLRLAVELLGPYAVGRVLSDVPLGRLLAALAAASVLGGLVRPSQPWWWTFALLLPGLAVLGLVVSIGQLHGRRRGGPEVAVADLRARIGALVTLISISFVGVLVFMSTSEGQLDLRAASTEGQLAGMLRAMDGAAVDRSELDDVVADNVDAPMVRSSWDGEWLRLWFEIRLGILPVRCVTGITGEGGWDTAVHTGPCT